MNSKYNKDLFNKLSKEKRSRIIESAVDEFATYGYNGANINRISAKAAISVGAMYKYFNNKRELYYGIIDLSVNTISSILSDIIAQEKPFFETIESIVYSIQVFSRKEVNLTKLYNHISTISDGDLILDLASSMEGLTANLYESLIENSISKGELSDQINSKYYAFFLDNLFMMLQFSYSCPYYKKRLKMFLGESAFNEDQLLIREFMSFIQGAFKSEL